MCTLKVSAYNFRRSLFLARIMEARFETIAKKKMNIEEKIDIVLSWPSEEAPPVIKWSLDANEDIGVVEVSSAIDDVFDIGESNVKNMKVRSEFSEFSENKKSVEEVVVGGGETCGVGEDELNRVISALKDGGGEFDGRLDEINLNLSEELADNGVSPIPTSLLAYESSRARQLWERIGIGDAHGLMDNGRNHKFVQPNVWGWMSDSQSAYSSYHLESKWKAEEEKILASWGPLSKPINHRMIFMAGLNINAKVTDLIEDNSWCWPIDWVGEYDFVLNVPVPTLSKDLEDKAVWFDKKDEILRLGLIAYDNICKDEVQIIIGQLVHLFRKVVCAGLLLSTLGVGSDIEGIVVQYDGGSNKIVSGPIFPSNGPVSIRLDYVIIDDGSCTGLFGYILADCDLDPDDVPSYPARRPPLRAQNGYTLN
ncbi:hypothetical protein Tco_0277499 [Tanacetum coccineum]